MVHVWIAGGGTGGHVYPGLAVLHELERLGPVEPLYIGGLGSVEERLIERTDLRFVGIPAGGLHGMSLWRAIWNLTKLARGFMAALRLGWQRRPQALFVTGGYASVPVAMAAWALRVPILLYLPDIEPGKAVQFISRRATRVGVTVEASRAYFPKAKTVLTGYPVRAEFGECDRTSAREALGLEPDRRVVLVFGGSQGARSINRAVVQNLEMLLQEAQLVHISGELDGAWVAEKAETLPPDLRSRYHPFSYLHEMGQALAAADLVVCRSGASTLGELPFFGLPAILVPYPHAWQYQRVNAQWLAEKGAAIVLEDKSLNDTLLAAVQNLDSGQLMRMGEKARALARPDAAARLAEQLWELASSAGEQVQ